MRANEALELANSQCKRRAVLHAHPESWFFQQLQLDRTPHRQRVAGDEDRAGESRGKILARDENGNGADGAGQLAFTGLACVPHDEFTKIAWRASDEAATRQWILEQAPEVASDLVSMLEPEQPRGDAVGAPDSQLRVGDEDRIGSVLEALGQDIELADPMHQPANFARDFLERGTFIGCERTLASVLDVDDPADFLLAVPKDRHAQLRTHLRGGDAATVVRVLQDIRHVLHGAGLDDPSQDADAYGLGVVIGQPDPLALDPVLREQMHAPGSPVDAQDRDVSPAEIPHQLARKCLAGVAHGSATIQRLQQVEALHHRLLFLVAQRLKHRGVDRQLLEHLSLLLGKPVERTAHQGYRPEHLSTTPHVAAQAALDAIAKEALHRRVVAERPPP